MFHNTTILPPPGSEQSGFLRLEPTFPSAKPTPDSEQRRKDVEDVCTPNILIFGETGVGKSSTINLIIGQKRAHTSNDAVGCTFEHERYTVTLDGVSCALWDTTGLDEGSEGTVPAALAEGNLRALVQGLARTGGIHLVIYCIRAGRLTKALHRNYHLFYTTVCRKKVPVALVVTGLEHRQGEMETWWGENEEDLRRLGMRFDAHACVTTLDIEDQIIQDRRSASQRRLRELVLEYSRLPPWRIKPSFISWILPTVRGVLRGTSPSDRPAIRKVVIYDAAMDSPVPTQLSPGITTVWKRVDGRIGDRHYEFVWLDKHALDESKSALQPVGGTSAGVLVFYTSPLVDAGISPTDIDTLKTFYDTAGGQTCPVVVVLRGCDDEEAARARWSDVTSRHSDIHAYLTFLPSTVDGQSDARAKLNEMVERLCIEHIEVVHSAFSKAYMTSKVEQFAHVSGFIAKRVRRFTSRT